MLLYFRAQSDFISLSFDTISSSGSNGAIIHYRYQGLFTLTLKLLAQLGIKPISLERATLYSMGE